MNIQKTGLLVGLRIVLVLVQALPRNSWAQPVPENERTPVDTRRTTLLARDIDRADGKWPTPSRKSSEAIPLCRCRVPSVLKTSR